MMKTPDFFLLCFLLFFSGTIQAQQFEQITSGSIATSQKDSRSCNFIDLNGDGFDDIFISNGPSGGQNNQLFLSNGNGTFGTIFNDPITQDQGASDGASFADVDNDGDLDAFVVTWYGERNYFYRNNGDGSFTFESSTAHTGNGTYSETCAWGDYDQDGWLDLYVTNSTDFVVNAAVTKRNQLWHNLGDGTFERITTGAPVSDADISRSVQWIDYDQDGDTDLFVSNEENERNRLYENNNGTFTNVSNPVTSVVRSSTGSSWADIDNDGDLDLFVANFSNQDNQIFRNNGDGSFTAINSGPQSNDDGCSFGSAFGDFDNDGDLDLFVTNGFCGNGLQNFLYKNNGSGSFSRDDSSIEDLSTQCSFGAAWGDYDNDGFLDLIVANCKGSNSQSQPRNTLLHNLGNDNNWIKFRLEGRVSNRSAIGARIRLKAQIDGDEVWQTRVISAQTGYNGQNSLTAHFGLKDANVVDSVEVYWPSGLISRRGPLGIGTTYELLEPTTNNASGLNTNRPSIRVAPNPVQDQLYVEIDEQLKQGESQIELVDASGRVVLKQAFQPLNAINLFVGHLPPGMYVLHLTQSGLRISESIVLH